GERLELPVQVRGGAFLHAPRDLLHLLGALRRREDLAPVDQGHHQRDHTDGGDRGDDRHVGIGERDEVTRRGEWIPGHSSSLAESSSVIPRVGLWAWLDRLVRTPTSRREPATASSTPYR